MLGGLARKDEPSLEISSHLLVSLSLHLEQSEAFNNLSSVLGDFQVSRLPCTQDTSHPQPLVLGPHLSSALAIVPNPRAQVRSPKPVDAAAPRFLGHWAPGSDRGREKGSFSTPAAPPTFLR